MRQTGNKRTMYGTDDFRQRMGLLAALLGGIGIALFALFSFVHPEPSLDRNYVDGKFENSRCGTIEFRNGIITFGKSKVEYTLERQKDGVVALTAHFLGVVSDNLGCHIVYDQSRFPLYLSFGGHEQPEGLDLWDVNNNMTYKFVRQSTL